MTECTTDPSMSQLGDAPVVAASSEGSAHIEQALRDKEGLIRAIVRREGGGSLSYEEDLHGC